MFQLKGILAITLGLGWTAAAFAGDIAWEKSVPSALAKSKSTGQPVVLLFGVGQTGGGC